MPGYRYGMVLSWNEVIAFNFLYFDLVYCRIQFDIYSSCFITDESQLGHYPGTVHSPGYTVKLLVLRPLFLNQPTGLALTSRELSSIDL